MATRKPKTPAEEKADQQEMVAVEHLLGQINRAKELTKTFRETTLPRLRRLAWGTRGTTPDNTDQTTRANMIFATMATLLPYIYAKNPDFSVSPSESVSHEEYKKYKDLSKTFEIMLKRLFIEEAELKNRVKSNIRSAMTTSVGWLKLTFQNSLTGDPIILRRHNDLQDNLQKLEALIASTKDAHDLDKLNLKKSQIADQMRTIMESDEVKTFKGFAIDRVQTEDVLILDESVVDFDDYVHAKKIAMGVWMTDEDYKTRFGKKPETGVSEFGAPAAAEATDEDGRKVQLGDGVAKPKFRRVWQVEDKTTQTIYTVAEGGKHWCRAPFVPKSVSERFYSLFCLGFNLLEGRWRPISDVELLEKLQEEYTTTRYLYAEARKEAIPTYVFRKSGNLTEEDISNLSKRRVRQFIGVEGNPTVPIDQDMMQFPGIAIDPQNYDVTLIRNDMDMMVGLSDASRANLIQAKTATEAELMKQALQNRVAERQDASEDMITAMGIAALEIMLQEFSPEEVREICGAGAVWPTDPDPAQIFRNVRVQVRAGSTGKPNQLKDREQWATIMPQISETAGKVAELRAAGNFDMANTLIEILKETLRRFDERIDLDQFIPPQQKDEQGNPVDGASQMLMQVQQQNQQLTEQLEACQEELQACQQQLAKAQSQEEAKVLELQQKQELAIEQERTRQVEAEAEARVREAEEETKRIENESRLEREFGLKKYAIDEEIALKRELANEDRASKERIAKYQADRQPKPAAAE